MKTTICNTHIRTFGRVKGQDTFRFLLSSGRGADTTNLYARMSTDSAFGAAQAVNVNLAYDSAVKLRNFLNDVLKEARA